MKLFYSDDLDAFRPTGRRDRARQQVLRRFKLDCESTSVDKDEITNQKSTNHKS